MNTNTNTNRSDVKPPKGFTVRIWKYKQKGLTGDWYNFKILKNQQIIFYGAATMFETKDDARSVGISYAWDIF